MGGGLPFSAQRLPLPGCRALSPVRAANKRRPPTAPAAGTAGEKSPEETKGGDKARLTLSEHCDIPPPNVRVWRNW